MRIGQKITFVPAYRAAAFKDEPGRAAARRVTGRVVWVHPAGRFALAEYEAAGMLGWGTPALLRECLPLTHGAADKGISTEAPPAKRRKRGWRR